MNTSTSALQSCSVFLARQKATAKKVEQFCKEQLTPDMAFVADLELKEDIHKRMVALVNKIISSYSFLTPRV